jgi:peptidoglycan/xylan/chitin deacetylase (PgdA/CDA1 family)
VSIVMITLTFDNGPDPEVTPMVLRALAARDILATFFVVGEQLARSREPAERAHAAGHWIGNHTYTHAKPLGRVDAATARAEIERTQELLGELAHPDRLFRPPGGGGALGPHLLNPAAAELLRAGAYTCVLWNAVPGDWKHPDNWVERALTLCAEHEHTLLVLHDLPSGAMRQLERFLDAGLEFTQDFPPACVPLRRGEGSLVEYVDPLQDADGVA